MSDDIPLRTPAYRVPRARGMDPATRRLALIAAGLGGALLVLIGVWSLSGGTSGGGSSVPVIAAPAGPVRVKPANPGGLTVPGADQAIFDHSTDGRDAGQGSLMPGPERPDLQALRAPGATAVPEGAASGGTGPSGAGPGGAATTGSVATPTGAAASDLPLPPAFQPPPAAAEQTAALPATTVLPRGASQPAPTPPARPAAGGGTTVQLAALPTRAAAEAEWQALRRRAPGLLAGRQLILAQATVAGRVWWRVRTAGFTSPAQARGFCTRMRAAGAACDVTPF